MNLMCFSIIEEKQMDESQRPRTVRKIWTDEDYTSAYYTLKLQYTCKEF